MKRKVDYIDFRDAFPQMPEECHEALITAARSVREDEPVRKFTFRTVLIAACIIVATMAVAMAAGSIFGWNDFFTSQYNVTVPETAQRIMADSGEQTYTVGKADFIVRNLYCDGHIAMVSTEIRLPDDMKAILCADDPFDTIGANGENGEQVAKRLGVDPDMTWAAAAKKLNLPLYSSRAVLDISASITGGYEAYEDVLYNDDGSLTYFSVALMDGSFNGEKVDGQIFLRLAEINPDDSENPVDMQMEFKDLSITLEAPIDTKEYTIAGDTKIGNFELTGVKAEHFGAGVYLYATFQAADQATQEEVYDTLEANWTDEKGDRLPIGLNLSEITNVNSWPMVTLEKMTSAEDFPEKVILTIGDGFTSTLTLKK